MCVLSPKTQQLTLIDEIWIAPLCITGCRFHWRKKDLLPFIAYTRLFPIEFFPYQIKTFVLMISHQNNQMFTTEKQGQKPHWLDWKERPLVLYKHHNGCLCSQLVDLAFVPFLLSAEFIRYSRCAPICIYICMVCKHEFTKNSNISVSHGASITLFLGYYLKLLQEAVTDLIYLLYF